ncbi:histidine phosphatase family protein [Cereibacter sp. SYSU M97828]|nr:histidine phosphatase family protein [Cereibacter flavus]
MKRLVLVRHGETEWNALRRLQGQTDIALNDRGRGQARALAPMVAGLAPDLAVASDLKRAAETAVLLGVDAQSEPRLREQDLGDWSGRDIAGLDAGEYQAWRAGQFVPEGAETWAVFRARVALAMRDALAAAERTAVLVCHGGVIRAALDAALELQPSRIIPVGPGSMTVLAYPAGGARLEAFNLRGGSLELNAPD